MGSVNGARTPRERVTALLAAVGMAALLSGCVPADASDASGAGTPSPSASASLVPPAPAEPTPTAGPTVGVELARFESVVDGDTIRTSAGTVRILGVDTPERGECGHAEASATLGRVLPSGEQLTLELPEAENDRDAYDRRIRYVTTSGGVDLGLLQLEEGNAVARYDSRDGYPEHPREAEYHAAQRATLGAHGVVTVSCSATPTPDTTPTESAAPWWTAYTSCSKLKKNTLGDPTGPFSRDDPAEAEIYDWFANRTGNDGDGDGDGLACEGR